jgi:hypothetical protein
MMQRGVECGCRGVVVVEGKRRSRGGKKRGVGECGEKNEEG